jgi:hypothetical protein
VSADFRVDPLKSIYERLIVVERELSGGMFYSSDTTGRFGNALTDVRSLLNDIRPTIIESAP